MPEINIMNSGSHENVATEYRGVTPTLAGYDCGRIPLQLQQKGAAVDVRNYSKLCLALQVHEMGNKNGPGREMDARLFVTIEQSPDGITWSELYTFEPAGYGPALRKVLTEFESYVRASYWYARPGLPSETIRNDVSVTWSLVAEALSGAA